VSAPARKRAIAIAPELRAAQVGLRVLESLARGREKALAQRRARLDVLRKLVRYEIRRERAAGTPSRGRASRIAARLSTAASQRTIFRVFASLSAEAEKRATVTRVDRSRGA
jgi:hypothetical protein